MSKFNGPGLYEFLIEAELQQYYNAFRNDLKIQNVAQLKYVSEDDLGQIGMSRPEIRRLTKYFQKHCPQTYLGKMKKKLMFRKDESIAANASLLSNTQGQGSGTRNGGRNVAPGRHIIQADSIVIHKTLGSGEFGTVQQGVWTSEDGERVQVAIKSLSQERMENNPVEFLKEAAIMHTVDHEHIVRLHGVVLDTSALMLVTELAHLRSLLECLKEPSMRSNLSVPTLFDFAIQICDGMEYLESKRLIHRDLAARNILVFSRNKVKISDFGLSRALGVGKDYYQTNFNVNLKLPIAWCAPECINFLRFTSASDVWAYAVTLWEMFSYGFQPWAALTGQQILEAIDEPNFQRLEKPECCPYEIYNQIMLNCWQHEATTRPTFAQLSQLLPECKPEQVQTLRESDCRSRRDMLVYDAADVITVLDKKPSHGEDGIMLWKGVLKCGKSGLFNPANTVTYLGSSLPSVNQQSQTPFHRSDSRSSSMRKGRMLSADMISSPQGDLKHTGHMGSDGQFFGDITFLTSKNWVPRQVVSPYRPESASSHITGAGDLTGTGNHFGNSSACGRSPQSLPCGASKNLGDSNSEIHSSDTAPLLFGTRNLDEQHRRKPKRLEIPLNNCAAGGNDVHGGVTNPIEIDHEYHEISDEENDDFGQRNRNNTNAMSGSGGHYNPALACNSRSQSPLDSPGFDKPFNLGPSLVDEVFGALLRDKNGHGQDEPQPQHSHQRSKSETKETSRHKKKFATVKPISSSDRRTLDQAIAIANELAARSMLDLDRPGKHSGNTGNSLDDISSPRTPSTPTHRRKFSFMLGSSKASDKERRNYSQEAASIPDIQSTLTEEAKEAYNSLIEKPSLGSLGFLTPNFETKTGATAFHFPENVSLSSKKSDFFDNEPLSPPPPTPSTSASSSAMFSPPASSSHVKKAQPGQQVPAPTPRPRALSSKTESDDDAFSFSSKDEIHHTQTQIHEKENVEEEEETEGNPLRLLRMNKQQHATNVLPLPPRESRSSAYASTSTTSRHQRKHPLLIPGRISLPAGLGLPTEAPTATATRGPPPPPPKPQRQKLPPKEEIFAEEEDVEIQVPNSVDEQEPDPVDVNSRKSDQNSNSSFENRSSVSFSVSESSASAAEAAHAPPMCEYENFETVSDANSQSQSTPRQSREFSENEKTTTVTSGEDVRSLIASFSSYNSIKNSNSRDEDQEQEVQARVALRGASARLRLGGNDNGVSASDSNSRYGYQDNQNQSQRDRIMSAPVYKTTEQSQPTKDSHSSLPPTEFSWSPMKVKTVQRILGSSATEEECMWSLEATNGDSAHAVKLLRLKALLPDSLLTQDIGRVISVLEMSHWDVARASSFILQNPSPQTASTARKSLFRSDLLNSNHISSSSTSTNTSDAAETSSTTTHGNPNSSSESVTVRNYLRPTQV